MRIGDFNADGSSDIYYIKGLGMDEHDLLWENTTAKYKITNFTATAQNITIDYAKLDQLHTPSSNSIYPNKDITTATSQFVASTKINDNVGGFYTTDYKYTGLKVNLHGRGGLGFARVDTTHSELGYTTTSSYYQEYPLTSRLKSSSKHLLSGKLIEEKHLTYSVTYLYNSSIAQVHINKQQKYNYDLDEQLLTAELTSFDNYDSYGNLLSTSKTITGNNQQHTTTTTNSYHNNQQTWQLGKIMRKEVTHSNLSDSQTKIVSFSYNAQGKIATKTIAPEHPLSTTTSYQYDSFGNLARTTITDKQGSRRTSSQTYNQLGQIISRTNALGHSETYSYNNPLCNLPTSHTGPNQLTTTYKYDSLCRTTQQTDINNNTSSWQYAWSDGIDLGLDYQNLGLPTKPGSFDIADNSLYMVTKTSSIGQPIKVYYDVLNRKLRTATLNSKNHPIYQDTLYNNRQQIVAANMPYLQGKFKGDQTNWTVNTYDALGRLIRATKPSVGGYSTTNFSYNGFTTTSVSANNHTTITTKNLAGKPLTITENDSSIEYTYDAMGQLIQTNTQGFIVKISYDELGNKLSVDDMSLGIRNYSYNAFGELITSLDAKGQITSYTYDKLGRKITSTSPDNQASWEYDTRQHGIGKLAQISNANATTSYSYNTQGQISQQLKIIANQEYITDYYYDQYARLIKTIQPDGLEIKRTYNTVGQLTSLAIPKNHVWDYDYIQLESAYEKTLAKIAQLNEQAQTYENKVISYVKQAQYYRYLANHHLAVSNHYNHHAQRLINYANHLEHWARYYAHVANHFRHVAHRYHKAANHHYHLASRAKWYKRSYKRRHRHTGRHYQNVGNNYMNASNHYSGYSRHLNHVSRHYRHVANHYRNVANHHRNIAYYFLGLANHAYAQARELSNQLSLIISELEDNRAAADTIKTALDARSNDNNYITLWTATSYDASGRLQGEVFGNGVLTRREVDPVTGHINRITTGMGDQLLRNISYSYDQRDNILTREDQLSGINETYSYDHMDRLSNWNYQDTQQHLTRTYEYDNRGNITYKTGAGVLEYDNGNRLIQRSHNNHSYTYSYDAGGNLLTGDNRTYTWNSFNKITSIASNGQTTNFSYDATNQRLTKQTTNTTTHYINRSFEIHHTTDQAGQEITNMRHNLFVGNEVVATYEKTLIDGQKTVDKTAYLHRDALGNIDTVTNNQGEIIIRRQFTPYGQEIPAPALLATQHLGNWTNSGGKIETDMGNKTITFAVTQTGTVTIELDTPIDSYLYLQNQDSQLLHQDDNSGTGNNAKITIHLKKGLYKIIAATAQKHQSGDFSLSLSANASFAAVRFNTQDLRGYTSHEHINETGLINMNARLYDPVIARFISPDTFIQAPQLTASYNRYIYVMGNPVKYNDPSGHFVTMKTKNHF